MTEITYQELRKSRNIILSFLLFHAGPSALGAKSGIWWISVCGLGVQSQPCSINWRTLLILPSQPLLSLAAGSAEHWSPGQSGMRLQKATFNSPNAMLAIQVVHQKSYLD